MVKADAEIPEDKKETSIKKEMSLRRKTVITGIWPCKINGCNKQFAREADLKRHQRTTKMHSMPGFACPQCDATFTRTDALRRHQKSRHNGVIIELSGDSQDGDENADIQSRTGSPSPKGKGKATDLPVPTNPLVSTPTGPSSYYRQHTATTTPYVPPRLQQTPQPNQQTSGQPISHWLGYSPWPDGTIPGPISYITHGYHPSPHYRPHTVGFPPPPSHPSAQPPLSPPPYQINNLSTNPVKAASSSGSRNSPCRNDMPHTSSETDSSSNPETDLDSSPLTEEEVAAAVEAVIKMHVQSEEAAKKQQEREEEEKNRVFGMDQDIDNLQHSGDELEEAMHQYTTSLDRPEPMEHMLTEDGEPMLNPAELLTQESLASPPPS